MENFKAGDDYSSDMGSEGSKDLFTILLSIFSKKHPLVLRAALWVNHKFHGINKLLVIIQYRALVRFSIPQVLFINETWESRTFCSKFQIFLN